MAWICSCGNQNGDDGHFCVHCGSPTDQGHVGTASLTKPSRSSWKTACIGCLGLQACLLFLVILIRMFSAPSAKEIPNLQKESTSLQNSPPAKSQVNQPERLQDKTATGQPGLSDSARQLLQQDRQSAVDMVSNIERILNSASFAERVEKYCRFTAVEEEKLFQTHSNPYQCQVRYMDAVNWFPSDSWFREKTMEWQKTITEIDKKLTKGSELIQSADVSNGSEQISSVVNSAQGRMGCVPYNLPLKLNGRIGEETLPGPPNYQSISQGDKPETVWVLNLDGPICTMQGDQDSEYERPQNDVAKLQLVFSSGIRFWFQEVYRSFISLTVAVTGKLAPQVSGHHHTKVMLEVIRIEPR